MFSFAFSLIIADNIVLIRTNGMLKLVYLSEDVNS